MTIKGLGFAMALSRPYEVTKIKREDPCDAAKVTSGSPNEMDSV